MKITWLGHSMFLFEDDQGTKIVTDPYNEYIGYAPPKLSAGIITLSHHHKDHANVSAVEGSPTVIDSIGKYNIEGITIEGIQSYHDEVKGDKRGSNIIFKFNIDGITLAHMGDYGQSTLSGEQAAALKGIDVLLILVGGIYTIDGVQAADIVNQLKPRIAIPMHYKTKDLTLNISTAEPFLRKMPIVKNMESIIELMTSSLPKETEVWVMRRFS